MNDRSFSGAMINTAVSREPSGSSIDISARTARLCSAILPARSRKAVRSARDASAPDGASHGAVISVAASAAANIDVRFTIISLLGPCAASSAGNFRLDRSPMRSAADLIHFDLVGWIGAARPLGPLLRVTIRPCPPDSADQFAQRIVVGALA